MTHGTAKRDFVQTNRFSSPPNAPTTSTRCPIKRRWIVLLLVKDDALCPMNSVALMIRYSFLTHLRPSRSPTIKSAGFDVNRGKSPIRKSEEQESGHTSRTSSPTLSIETVWKAELVHWEEWKRFQKHHHRSLPDQARSSEKEKNQQTSLTKIFIIQFYIWFLIFISRFQWIHWYSESPRCEMKMTEMGSLFSRPLLQHSP
jgi:hypothetical protein